MAEKPGLYANIHKAQRRAKRGGKPVRKKGAPGAPTDAQFKKAAKTAKKTTKKKSAKKKTAKKKTVRKTTARKSTAKKTARKTAKKRSSRKR